MFSFDEADRLLETSYHSDFFALLRSWHNARALDEQWQKINVVMVISTEPYLLIAETNQSPFNVGLKIYLEDFSREQVSDLNARHGSPITAKNFDAFMSLLAGQPYLTRKALYTLAIDKWDWTDLVNNATKEPSPFSDHLRRQHWLLNKAPDLQEALKQIIRSNKCDNNSALLRLLQAGIIKGSGDAYSCRCELYSRYFRERLL